MSENALWRFRMYTVAVIACLIYAFPTVLNLLLFAAGFALLIAALTMPLGLLIRILSSYWITGKLNINFRHNCLQVSLSMARGFVALDVMAFALAITICLIYPQIDPRSTELASAIIALSIWAFCAVQIIEAFVEDPFQPLNVIPQAVQA